MYRAPDDSRENEDPPASLKWSETLREGGAAAAFQGPAPSVLPMVGAVLAAAAALSYFVLLPYLPNKLSAQDSRVFTLIPLAFLGFSFWLAWRARAGGPNDAALDLDTTRLRVRPKGLLARAIEVPTSKIESFHVEVVVHRSRMAPHVLWYRVHAALGESGSRVVAAFGDRDCAAFLSARLLWLVGKARARARA